MATLPRLLEQLGWRTCRYVKLHEANAAANDLVQHGYIRMLAKSYLVKFLALAYISHYIWIARDLDKIHMVGPNVSVHAFIRMSNVVGTRTMLAEGILELKTSCGLHDALTDVSKDDNI